MLSRRELLTAGMAGGLTTGESAATAGSAQSQEEIQALREIARNLARVDNTVSEAWMSNTVTYGLAAKVRAQFDTYFRTNQKFPDFIDVGFSVFMDIYDWHIKNRQQLTVTRGPDARYWVQFMFTNVILRGEHDVNYIGIPYDKA